MRKIVIAPDSFKESFKAMEAADAIERGFRRVFNDVEYVKIPMADGGEGTVQSLVDALDGTLEKKTVVGPLGNEFEAEYGISGDGKVAIIEMAAASGLHLVSLTERNPLLTTTYGTGQLIVDALEKGVDHIIIGIGGSATNDGGAGLAEALGAKLLTHDGTQIGYGGAALADLERIEVDQMHPRLKKVTIEVACDVDNPLLGKQGASAIYGPQKGADEEMITELDRCLAHYADKIEQTFGKDIRDIPGAGAAGGLGAGLLAFLDVRLDSGVTLVLEATEFDERVKGASLVITGEGQLDQQTIFGKTPIGVAKAAKKIGIPVLAIAGSLGKGHEVIFEHGIDAAFSLVPGVVPLEDALENGIRYLEETAYNIAKMMNIQQQTIEQ